LVAAILGLAHTMGLQVVAEGVETVAQRDFLLRHDCCQMQGFLFDRPMPADAFEQVLFSASSPVSPALSPMPPVPPAAAAYTG
jgi:EAL domain-containing protein (putative c-di-GMP-specific phosphodiesterase class I)